MFDMRMRRRGKHSKKKNEELERKVILTSSVIKYVLPLILSLLAFKTHHNILNFLTSLLELAIILFITELLYNYSKWLAYFINTLLIFLFNVEQICMFFGGTYLSLIMLSNVDSIKALSGNIVLYISMIIPVVIFTFLPITKLIKNIKINRYLLGVFILVDALIIVSFYRNLTTPFFNYFQVGVEKYNQIQLENRRKAHDSNITRQFYKSGIPSSVKRPSNLSKNPNVILIFTEGLSQSVIENQKNVMPNIASLEDNSLNFTNYYNHTFATYRGIIGQLYSGYQFDNYDVNKLISIQDILKNQGYSTTFINAEPDNETFTKYLRSFDFNNLATKSSNRKGHADSLSDAQSYKLLLKTAENSYKEKKPFFISMYTFGTHISLDSTDKKYKDGTNSTLNKYYDLDYQFGKFLKEFKNSKFATNTLLVFTTDHATYADNAYIDNFGDRAYGSLDKIPLLFYYKGITPQKLDANGRNSLDLAPTILDYLDISEPNYFLGKSLFSESPVNEFETVFNSENNYMSTKNNRISGLSASEKSKISKKIENYFTANQQDIEKE